MAKIELNASDDTEAGLVGKLEERLKQLSVERHLVDMMVAAFHHRARSPLFQPASQKSVAQPTV
jgi:hypothetical protein